MTLEFFEIFSGLLSGFGVILELHWNKTWQKWNFSNFLNNFNSLNIFYKKILILTQKWVSGMPYLKKRTWEFHEMHIKLKHLGPLDMWNYQNSWKWKWPFFWTVPVGESALMLHRNRGSLRCSSSSSLLPCLWILFKGWQVRETRVLQCVKDVFPSCLIGLTLTAPSSCHCFCVAPLTLQRGSCFSWNNGDMRRLPRQMA